MSRSLAFASPQTWQQASGYTAIPTASLPDGELPPDLEVEWLGHAGHILTIDGTRIAIDPNLSTWCSISKRRWPAPLSPTDLHADLVLISHAHMDHLDFATLTGMPASSTIIMPSGADRYLPDAIADDRVVVLELNQTFADTTRFGDLRITAVIARHNGSRGHPFASSCLAVGYIIQSAAHTLYVAGDTGYGPHFQAIREQFAPDMAILPVGAFSPRIPLKWYHLNPQDAVKAAQVLNVRLVVPSHFGTFALSFDSPDTALPRFAGEAARVGIPWYMPTLPATTDPGPSQTTSTESPFR